ncbi:adenylyl cyclase (AC) class IV domain-containing protein [Elysia marginata]|uniref:Adenylyl cyclase (AC) class IV domain-containing protein n=1 Tax=Elysia marginata TaxID=1093978 RepID=A0AAV4H2F6_9GAST|nr:adenylyl cyclase (AC) class IV domain-containing protein [Elysia marginata]
MPRNVEIKARVSDLASLTAKAKALAGDDGSYTQQVDTFFNAANGRLKLRSVKGERAKLIHYNRPDQSGPKLSDFHITLIDDVDGLKKVLANTMGVKGEVKKTRHLIMYDQTRIHIDDVDGLGHFMELEVQLREDQTVADGERIAHDIMDKLDINKEDLITSAYMDLLLKNV